MARHRGRHKKAEGRWQTHLSPWTLPNASESSCWFSTEFRSILGCLADADTEAEVVGLVGAAGLVVVAVAAEEEVGVEGKEGGMPAEAPVEAPYTGVVEVFVCGVAGVACFGGAWVRR